MNVEKKVCVSCKQDFTIEPEDFEFYTKIGVPAPTFCPECRMIRRFSYRNERSFHKRNCSALGHSESIVSIFQSPKLAIYDSAYWWSDAWNPLDYGKDYNFNKNFFVQFNELFEAVPLPAMWSFQTINSDYANYSLGSKNAYLCTSAISGSENVLYSSFIDASKDALDCLQVKGIELGCELLNVWTSRKVHHLVECRECTDSAFLFDCANCHNCFMSSNLRNKQYVFRGEELRKEDYESRMKSVHADSYAALEVLKDEFHDRIKNSIHRYANLKNTIDCTGSNLENCKAVKNVYFGYNIENVKDSWRVLNYRDSRDISGGGGCELMYEGTVVGLEGNRTFFSHHSHGNEQIEYSAFCMSSKHLFGCVGLRHKEYCIFNKQYEKVEYEELRERIINQMSDLPYITKKGEKYCYGEFFPTEFSPFGYNETPASENLPLTKNEAFENGYKWTEKELKQYSVTKESSNIEDSVYAVSDAITKDVISCATKGEEDYCTSAFRILPQEFELYKKLGVALPRICPNCRHRERLKLRNPFKLWKRGCMCNKNHASGIDHGKKRCENIFETSYAPDRVEVVYCESCYLDLVQ